MLLGNLLCALGAAAFVVMAPARAADVSFDNSIRAVEAAPVAGPPPVHKAWVSRAALRAEETGAVMRFEVALKMRSFAELQGRVARRELIPKREMAAKYHPLLMDYQAVAAWLKGQGFTITRQDDNHLALFAQGSVSLLQRAFHVTFARVTLDGTEFTAATTAPRLPAEIASAVLGINGLQPFLRARKHSLMKQVTPNGVSGTNPPYIPSQLAQAYDASGLYSTGVSGSGEAVAIVIDTFPLTSDLTTFWQNCKVPQTLNNIQFIQVVSGSLPAPSGEESLDVEWSSSVAPADNVRIYATTDLEFTDIDQAYQQIFADATAHPEYGINQASMSFGLGELYYSASQLVTDSQYLANLASAGVTLFASSGDGGSSPGTGGAGDNSGPTQVEYPASDPSVTGVGGTSLELVTSGSVSSETAWNLSGGGRSVFFTRPTWQVGNAVLSGTQRCVPDIASGADPNTGAYVYLNGAAYEFGGTSWGSPTWAGFCALLNESRANVGLFPLGVLGPAIFPLQGTSNFRDITSGSNGAYTTGPGYDLVTGIGVGDVQMLAQTLVGVQTTPPWETIAPSLSATFTAATSGTGYQWQRLPIGTGSGGWSNLAESGTYVGTETVTLSIEGATTAMSGDRFRCVINTGTNVVTSSPPSTLIVDTPLVVQTLAGQPLMTGTMDGGGAGAQFAYPSGVALDGSGNLYIADYENDTIRKVTPSGVVSTPYGQPGVSGTMNGPGNVALFNTPNAIAVDGSNNFYVADSGNNCIRKISNMGVVSTLAGKAGSRTLYMNGMISKARFNNPQGITVDGSGNIYVADTGNEVVRKISNGMVTTVAGTVGSTGYVSTSGTSALLNEPLSVAADSAGNVYIADLLNYVIREITPAGVVTTPYGTPGVPGRADGVGNAAQFNSPIGITVDGSNNLYVIDSQVPTSIGSTSSGNNLLRRITPAGVVSTIAGDPGVTGTDDGSGKAAEFYSPQAAAVNGYGVVYIADTFNQTIRQGGIAPEIMTLMGSQTATQGQPVTLSVSVGGTGPYTYQWYYDGVPIQGATGSSYTIPDVSGSNAGTYMVVVMDPFGSSTSMSYTLTVSPAVPALEQWAMVLLPLLLWGVASRYLRKRGNSIGTLD